MEPLLEVRNLTKTFQNRGSEEFAAVNGVSFQLYPHEILGIVGESGSGKSTVAKMIARLLDVTQGDIFLKGETITHVTGRRLREIYRVMQMIFQSPASSFDPRRTLGDGIGESLRNSGTSRKETEKKVKELLLQCGLTEEYGQRYPHEVSGGQCQRAAIARALAIQPELLICDEATSALDVTVQAQVVELLKNLQREMNLSLLFISHDLALVQALCNRVLVMHQGKIVEEGAPDEVILHPREEYTRKLIDSVL